MAGKAPTYAEQVQTLKAEKQSLIEENERLRNSIESETALRNEIADLEAQLAAKSKVDNQGNVGLQAKLNDANSRAESEAANAKRLREDNSRLVVANEMLSEQLLKLNESLKGLDTKDKEHQKLYDEYNNLRVWSTRRERNLIDQISEKDALLQTQSAELRTLRLARDGNERLITELKASTEEVMTEAKKQVEWYKAQVDFLKDRLAKTELVVAGYHKLVESIPDTKAQLLAILNSAPNDESTE